MISCFSLHLTTEYQCCITKLYAGTRVRDPGEITPVSAERTFTSAGDNLASNAIDLDWSTRAVAQPDHGTSWIRLNLGQVYCVKKVVFMDSPTDIRRFWTCSETQCTCTGSRCSEFSFEVSTGSRSEEDVPHDPLTVRYCRYGDTVQVNHLQGLRFAVNEIAVFKFQCE